MTRQEAPRATLHAVAALIRSTEHPRPPQAVSKRFPARQEPPR